MTVAPQFLGREIAIAIAVAALAQLSFVGLFLLPAPAPVEADFSDESARPLSVAITPVPLLKLGSKNPGKLPGSWERAPAAARATPTPTPRGSPPSTKADVEADPVKTREAGVAPVDAAVAVTDASTGATESDAEARAPSDGDAAGPASSVLGSPNGSPDGTETDPLKGRAADMYRGQLAAWFAARFTIRGKVPFDTLKTLSATAVVSVSAERRVTGFSLTRPSGDAGFDGEVTSTLDRIRSSGAELPAPPPAYPDMLTRTVPVSFRCTVRSQCE